MSSLKDRIKMVRGKNTQADFAKMMKIPLSTLGRYERGENKPDLTFLESLSAKFGVSLDWLVLGKGEVDIQEGLKGNSYAELKVLELEAKLAATEREMSMMQEIIDLHKENVRLLLNRQEQAKAKPYEENLQNVYEDKLE